MKTTVAAIASLICFSSSAYAQTEILDYGNAFFFAGESDVNRLFIDIEGRLRVDDGSKKSEYYLLYPHPREYTWRDDGAIYKDMIAANGASVITFIIEKNGSAVMSRRYQRVPLMFGAPHQCAESPYKDAVSYEPATAQGLEEITDLDGILEAASAGDRIVGLVEYEVEGVTAQIDFPVRVMNINPETHAGDVEDGKQWQVASSRVPIWVGGEDECEGIRNGHVAFGDFKGDLQFVYQCGGDGWLSSASDLTCTVNFPGTARIFRK